MSRRDESKSKSLNKLCLSLRERWSKSETAMSEPPRLVSPGENLGPARKGGSFVRTIWRRLDSCKLLVL